MKDQVVDGLMFDQWYQSRAFRMHTFWVKHILELAAVGSSKAYQPKQFAESTAYTHQYLVQYVDCTAHITAVQAAIRNMDHNV